MGEAMPNFHIRSCLAFGHCNDTASNGATFVRFEWPIILKDPSWPEMLPAVDQALKCMTDKKTIHIEQSWSHNEVFRNACCFIASWHAACITVHAMQSTAATGMLRYVKAPTR